VDVEEKTMTIREVRDSLGRCVDAAYYANEATVITKNGEPRAAVVPHDVYLRCIQAN
jgi:antitoxin (DNA-binding transcriptional repressor) of toxin-antitoxin stability system